MASSDDVLMRGMSGFRKEVGQPLKVPVEPGQYDSSVSDRYNEIREELVRPEYRGFTVPAGMEQDESDQWFAAIDAREDERERKEAESFLTRKPEPWEGQFLEQMKALNLAASQEEQRFLRDPEARGEAYKEFAGEVYEDVMAGDPETIRNVADVSSLVDVTGASDVTSAVQSGRLAYREPEQRGSHLTDVAISGVAGSIQLVATALGAAPLVGNLLSGARLKAAMKADSASLSKAEEAIAASLKETTVVDDAGEPLRVYHGTPRQFDEFDTARMEGRTPGSKPEQTEGQGTYFTPSKASASKYAGEEGRVVEAFLDIKNPFIVGKSPFSDKARKVIRDYLETQHSSEFYIDEKMSRFGGANLLSGTVPPSVITAAMKADGFDGVKSLGPQGTEYVVFDAFQIVPTQGKPAIAAKDPVFESALEKAAVEKIQNKTGVDAVISTLRSGGATKSEIADAKVAEFVEQAKAEGKKSVTKDELIKHLDDNKVQIDEVRLGGSLRKLPKEIEDLSDQKFVAFESLESEATAASRVLAPDKSASAEFDKLLDNPNHFTRLYLDYVGGTDRIEGFENVPPGVEDVVNGVIDLNKNVSVSDWTPEDAARITNARNVINAKLADPEYQQFVEQQRSDFIVVPGVDNSVVRVAHQNIRKHENLTTIARILNEMPEAETRLAALRQFQASRKYQEYSRLSKDFREKYTAFQDDTRKFTAVYERYSVPHGDNYQEILLMVPDFSRKIDDLKFKNNDLQTALDSMDDAYEPGTMPDLEMKRAVEIEKQIEANQKQIDVFSKKATKPFTDSHHRDIPNVLVHIRTKDRFDHKGRKILFVEEIQSDWHQAGRSRGYASKPIEVTNIDGKVVGRFATEEEAIEFGDDLEGGFSYRRSIDPTPDAPLKDTKEWTALAIRRIFREAADGGYDGVAFSRADMITPVVTLPRDEAMDLIGEPEAFLQRLENLKQRGGDLAEGAEQAEKVFKGNQYYYDKLLPSIAKKESKGDAATTLIELKDVGFSEVKERHTPGMSYPGFNLAVERLVDRGEVIEVPFFELTDKVRDRVIKPQKLYSVALPGIAVGAAAAEEEELSAAAALGALGMGGMALYKGAKAARVADLKVPTETSAYEGQQTVGKVVFDSKDGMGAVSNSKNVAYKGFVVWMKPQDFLGLNPVRSSESAADTVKAVTEAIEEGKPIGPPFLNVKLVKDGDDAGSFQVVQHEGRGRMAAINSIQPDVPVPVHVFGRGAIDRGRDLTPEMMQGLVDPTSNVRLLPDKKATDGKAVTPDAAWHVPDSDDYDPNYLPVGKTYRADVAKPPATDVATAGAKTDTPEFKTWFGKSKVVDEAGEPLVVYHGTRGDFEVFEPSLESAHYGTGSYFTDRPEYASVFTKNRGERLGEMEGSIIPSYVSIENPLEIDASTFKAGDAAFDEIAKIAQRNMADPEFGKNLSPKNKAAIADFEANLDKSSVGDPDVAMLGGSPYRAEAIREYATSKGHDGVAVRSEHEDLDFFYGKVSEYNSAQEIAEIESTSPADLNRRLKIVDEQFKDDFLQVDGKTYYDYPKKFPTKEYIVFDSTQIKSKFNPGTFDPTNPSIMGGIGVGAAVPAAAAVRSQRQEEQGNPLLDPPEYESMSYEGGYSQAIDFSETAALVEKMIGLSNEAQDLYTQMGLIEAEYGSLTEEDKIGKRGKLLAEWYDDSADKFSEAGRQLDESEYDRYLMGSDTYYDTDPKGIQGYDDVRLFVNTGYSGDPMLLDADLRASQENKQRNRLKETIGNGGPMLDMFGKSGDLNRYLYQKAKFFEHPVQTVQLNNDQKRILAKDYYNLEALKETGLISYLLYKELLGNVELV